MLPYTNFQVFVFLFWTPVKQTRMINDPKNCIDHQKNAYLAPCDITMTWFEIGENKKRIESSHFWGVHWQTRDKLMLEDIGRANFV